MYCLSWLFDLSNGNNCFDLDVQLNTRASIASLPMYDFPEVRAATNALWTGIAHHFEVVGLEHVPQQLVHDQSLQTLWSDPSLLFSQCCGYDVVYGYRERLQVLATPRSTAPGCVGTDYASVIVVPEYSRYKDVLDMHGTVAVINGVESHSGMNALFGLVASHSRGGKFFSEVKISGSHTDSLAMLQKGEADVASIDCITYALFQRYRSGALDGTRQLGLTCRAPTPPYVTRRDIDPSTVMRMKNALKDAFEDPSLASTKELLLLEGIEIRSTDTYRRIVSEFKHDLTA